MLDRLGIKDTILVFGSINMDLVVKASRLPVPGETLLGYDFYRAGWQRSKSGGGDRSTWSFYQNGGACR
jgi:sugar/nucleoside kinase (ribokinase family)